MIKNLKTLHPISKIEHKCMFCGGKIVPGQKYNRSTFIYDVIYDWIAHEECTELAYELDMFDDCDDYGLDGESFRDNLQQYVYDYHYDDSIDDIAKDWQLPYYDIVKKILEERRE